MQNGCQSIMEKVERKLITQIQSLLNRAEHLSINIMNVDVDVLMV